MVQQRACDACHKRKIQCDSTTPGTPCDWCGNHDLACTFDRVRGRKRKAMSKDTPSVQQIMFDRLEQIEVTLAQTIARQESNKASPASSASNSSTPAPTTGPSVTIKAPKSNPLVHAGQLPAYDSLQHRFASRPASVSSPRVSYAQIHYHGHHFGHISCHNGIPILSENGQKWISARAGENVSFAKFHQPLPPRPFYISPTEFGELPDKAIVDVVVDIFFGSAFRLLFPVIDRVLFEETLTLAYARWEERPSAQQLSAQGCVLAFLSITRIFQGQVENLPDIDIDICGSKVHYLLAEILKESNIVNLQTVFMLHMHQILTGRSQTATMLHTVACRIVLTLGGQMCKPTKAGPTGLTRADREVRQLRRLFWLCFIFDKDIALRTSQPPLISGDYCDLTLPDDYLEWYSYLPDLERYLNSSSLGLDDLTPHFPGDPRLCFIKEKTCRLLYSVQAQRKSDADILRDIRELDDELESWRQSLPLDFRPTLSISKRTQLRMQHMKLPSCMHFVGLQMEYHHLLRAIHRASERCSIHQAQNNPEGYDWSQGVNSSIAISLEASRSTLIFLKAAVNRMAGGAFWALVFYPTAAIIPLFFNILTNPLDPQAEDDLDILSSAADLIRNMPICKVTSRESGHINMVLEYVGEVIEFARCAMSKARREQGIGL
ncbi:hypothetical protein B0J13DRAFT_37257 [Dactylonectria estremocensis]|uniref:Zn(2)-C6 fungal-type domain-containing protein n=1 Tax=Dactylonectria estremocensis TaxID=1079267 RepID=A0A9P9JJA0_9HYPO|nr:hypothetical protein B0J13DRAFT_37257 [Dactylonectria estremocensis]